MNKSGSTKQIAFIIRLESASTTWAYSGLRKEDQQQGIRETGICTAAAHLYGTLSQVGSGSGTVAAGQDLKLDPYQLNNNAFRGAVHELTVIASPEKIVQVYAVVTDNTADWGSFDSAVRDPGVHVRGS